MNEREEMITALGYLSGIFGMLVSNLRETEKESDIRENVPKMISAILDTVAKDRGWDIDELYKVASEFKRKQTIIHDMNKYVEMTSHLIEDQICKRKARDLENEAGR